MTKIIIAVVLVILAVFLVRRSASNKKAAIENKEKGADFLASNGELEGVKTTSSGLQYLLLNEGTGDEYPKAKDRVRVHYHGTLIDGTVFDSSVVRGQPIDFGLNQVIKGWTEGLQLMVVGDKARLFIPSELAYGNSSAGKIGPGSVLIFEVTLLGINE